MGTYDPNVRSVRVVLPSGNQAVYHAHRDLVARGAEAVRRYGEHVATRFPDGWRGRAWYPVDNGDGTARIEWFAPDAWPRCNEFEAALCERYPLIEEG